MAAHQFDVYLQGKLIDTVFYPETDTEDDVKHSLISHDGYDSGIIVKKGRRKAKTRGIGESAQEIPDGTKVKFDSRGFSPDELGGIDLDEYDGQIATVTSCAIACEPGVGHGFYDITFDDGKALAAISGYHLTPVKSFSPGKKDSDGYSSASRKAQRRMTGMGESCEVDLNCPEEKEELRLAAELKDLAGEVGGEAGGEIAEIADKLMKLHGV